MPPTILFVEDHEDARTAFAELFTLEGYMVTTAACIEEALHALSDRPYDAVVTDYFLPDGTGTELVAMAEERGLLKGARVALFTACIDLKPPPNMPVIEKASACANVLHAVRRLIEHAA